MPLPLAPSSRGYGEIAVYQSRHTPDECWPLALDVIAETQETALNSSYGAIIGRARDDGEDLAAVYANVKRMAQTTASQRSDNQEIVEIVARMAADEIVGLGPIERYRSDPLVTEIMVNGPDSIFIERDGVMIEVSDYHFRNQQHLLDICQRLLRPLNREINTSNPLTDGRLPDRSRVNIVHDSLAPDGPILTIRRPSRTPWTWERFIAVGLLPRKMAEEIATLVRARANILLAGATHSGKTSLLSAATTSIPHQERLVVIEDTMELIIDHPNMARMEARPPSVTGNGEISIRQLVRNSLRQRPDRIIVGEVRDAAAYDMLQAMSTGHEGSLTTAHGQDALSVLGRLADLAGQTGVSSEDRSTRLVGSAIDIVCFIRFDLIGKRRLTFAQVVPPQNSASYELAINPIWEYFEERRADGKIYGEWERVGELDEKLRTRLRLDLIEPVVIDELEGEGEAA